MTPYPKRLIEADLPIARVSAHARREKHIHHGHISTMHRWWARRPLAACRAVLCAALWPDPADELCPPAFRVATAKAINEFAQAVMGNKSLASSCSEISIRRWNTQSRPGHQLDPENSDHWNSLRHSLLDFIADFANWDNSNNDHYLTTSRALTQTAHEALGGLRGTRPLVVDPFAGGGSIPLEGLRLGADAFASDLNPVAVLLNKMLLEYIPKYRNTECRVINDEGEEVVFSGLADAFRYYGNWIKERAEAELAGFYPKDPDDATPIAYLWARTIISEAPDDGAGDGIPIPVEVPLLHSMWLVKKKNRYRALRWVRGKYEKVQTETIEKTYANGVSRTVRIPLLEIFEPVSPREVENGTVSKGDATCPVSGYTTPVKSVRAQLRKRKGGANDARLFCVVITRSSKRGRFYRLPTGRDLEAIQKAAKELERLKREHTGALSLIPNEELDIRGIRRTTVMVYGMERWEDLFTPRQSLVLSSCTNLLHKSLKDFPNGSNLIAAIQTCLGVAISRHADVNSSLGRWGTTGESIISVFGRQAIPMVWDFAEANSFSNSAGSFEGGINWISRVIAQTRTRQGSVEQASATRHPLPDDSAEAVFTDPPYYDSIPYSYLSDFFYVWLRRSLSNIHKDIFTDTLVPKDEEIVVDRPHKLSPSTKNVEFYEQELKKAFQDSRRLLAPSGVCVIVFASKTTASWEAVLQAVVEAGLTVTASWPIDTEMAARVAAQGQARLASSIHLVCRPREKESGELLDTVGDWREVLQELPLRVHAWLPRLASEGVVGADAIFACLGPALEIFSRYAHVEKASGEVISLGEYLEYVWAAIAKEALEMVFEGADATGFEEDSRLTAMWLWTLLSNAVDSKNSNGKEIASTGYMLEYDAARKIAQGLGAHLERLINLVEVKGSKARLLPVAERTQALFGKGGGRASHRQKRDPGPKQLSLLANLPGERAAERGRDPSTVPGEAVPEMGHTTLNRVHQSMLLFATGRSNALKRLLVEDGAGQDERFWRLAQALSALYPANTDEKRWVDGMLARKKGLGF